MKRILIALLPVLLLLPGTMPARAAEGLTLTLTASAEAAAPGDTVTFTLTAESDAKCSTFGLLLKPDPQLLEITGGECSARGAMLPVFDAGLGFAVLYGTPTAPEGTVGTFTARIRDDAPAGQYTVTGQPSAREGESSLPVTVIPAVLTVTAAPTPETAAPETAGAGETTPQTVITVTRNQSEEAISGQFVPAQTEAAAPPEAPAREDSGGRLLPWLLCLAPLLLMLPAMFKNREKSREKH